VIHVAVQRCFNVSGWLKDLTATGKENLSVQTLSKADEEGVDMTSYQQKDARVQKATQQTV